MLDERQTTKYPLLMRYSKTLKLIHFLNLQNKLLEIKSFVRRQKFYQTYKEATAFLPEVLGVNERQRYLVLLQNESEIRSTGGWLTSYGIIGVEGGQIRELFVDDIYNADGTLRVQGK